jgi:hypothetical protein
VYTGNSDDSLRSKRTISTATRAGMSFVTAFLAQSVALCHDFVCTIPDYRLESSTVVL